MVTEVKPTRESTQAALKDYITMIFNMVDVILEKPTDDTTKVNELRNLSDDIHLLHLNPKLGGPDNV